MSPKRQWDVSYTSIVPRVQTIRIPRVEGSEPPGGANACNGWYHFKTTVTRAILSRYFIARQSRSTRLCSCTLRLCRVNKTKTSWLIILRSSLVLVGCFAKRKRTISRRVQERLDREQFHYLWRRIVKRGKRRRSRVCRRYDIGLRNVCYSVAT